MDAEKLPSVQELPVQSAICVTEDQIEADEVCQHVWSFGAIISAVLRFNFLCIPSEILLIVDPDLHRRRRSCLDMPTVVEVVVLSVCTFTLSA